jgi:type I restriction enzyme, R subunit
MGSSVGPTASPAHKRHLDAFISPTELYPVIATTSKLMTTGVDAQTCKLIVLDSNISSMTEFKQIIGRGTRINEDFGKYYFTIKDFRNVTALFADKEFDGDPVRVKEADQDDDISDTENEEGAPIVDAQSGQEVRFPQPETPDVTITDDRPGEGRRHKITFSYVRGPTNLVLQGLDVPDWHYVDILRIAITSNSCDFER